MSNNFEQWEQLLLFSDNDVDIIQGGQLSINFEDFTDITPAKEKQADIITPYELKVNSISAANELAVKNKLAIEANFSGFNDLTIINTVLQELSLFYSAFSKMPILDFVGTQAGYNSRNTLLNADCKKMTFSADNLMSMCCKINNNPSHHAYKMPYDFCIVLNENLLQSDIWKDDKYNFHPAECNNIRGCFYHELGHYLERQLNAIQDKKIKSTFRQLRKLKAIAANVSEYANTNTREFIAECYAEYNCAKMPRQTACEISNRLIELYTETYEK